MLVIKTFSWLCYSVGVLGLFVGLVDGPFSLISFGIALLVTGVFFQAMDYALNLLKDIRDAVVSDEQKPQNTTISSETIDDSAPQKSMEELTAELSALGKKLDKA